MPIRLESLDTPKRVHFVGWTGTVTNSTQSANSANTIEIGKELGELMGFHDGMIVEAQIEYGSERVTEIELEPMEVIDFDLIQDNCEWVEENVLNQLQVVYQNQCFVIYFPN